jgi:glucosamine--fructose-6-phosphate aminotransferase (isomerizing)
VFTQNDETRAGIEELIADLLAQGAAVLAAGTSATQARVLPTEIAHPVIQPMLFAQSFYRLANSLALARGRDPDRPPHLNKVTETL